MILPKKTSLYTVMGMLWLLAGYFFYHALAGAKGYIGLQEKRLTFAVLRQRHDLMKKNLQKLKNKVNLLEKNIDQDLLEQELWKKLCRLPKQKKVLLLRTLERD